MALLEGLVAVGLSLWVVAAWFRRRWDRRGALARRVGRGSSAAYVLHPPVLVLAWMATRPLPLAPEGKFVLVAAVGVAASFTLGAALTWRRVVVHVERPRVA